jgi:hypothetical protein
MIVPAACCWRVKRSYFGCLILFLLLWVAGVAFHLPGTQRDLAIQTRAWLDRPEYDGVFDKVVVSFSGQEATLTGAVARDEEKVLLETIPFAPAARLIYRCIVPEVPVGTSTVAKLQLSITNPSIPALA